jgi:hypothetical protein
LNGWVVLALVVAANVVIAKRDRELWLFLAPLSVCQVVPDWALVEVTGTLRFPDTGGPRVDDAVPLAMAGMWVIPLYAVVALARDNPWAGALLALSIFGLAELAAPYVDLWEPAGGVREVAGVAIYVLPAEAALGAATVIAWRDHRSPFAAPAVSALYLGALVAGLLWLR